MLVRLGRSTPSVSIFFEKVRRCVDASEGAIATEHDEHVENSGTRRHTGERQAERLKNLSCPQTPRFCERAERVFQRLRLPAWRGAERLARRQQCLARSRRVLPRFRDGLWIEL